MLCGAQNLTDGQNKNVRNTNIEWLRIISMLLIIAYHATRSGYTSTERPLPVYTSGIVLGSWGLLGVDLFLIISAWFLTSQQFRFYKVIHIVFQTFTWVLGYSVLFVIYNCFYLHHDMATVITDFFNYSLSGFFQPLWCKYYWFITTYFFMLLLSPFLNKLLDTLSRTQVSKLLLAFIFVPIYAQFANSPVCDVFYFLYVYLLIGYIKKYGSQTLEKYAKARFYISLIALVILSKLALYALKGKSGVPKVISLILNHTLANTGRHSMIILLISLLIFFSVLRKKATCNKVVNKIAACCLGVYLFHENHLLELPNTLDKIFGKLTSYGFLTADVLFPLRYAGAVLGVFVLGVILEWLRDRILQRPFMKYVSTKWEDKLCKLDNRFNSF